jgi:hypothetical protein
MRSPILLTAARPRSEYRGFSERRFAQVQRRIMQGRRHMPSELTGGVYLFSVGAEGGELWAAGKPL